MEDTTMPDPIEPTDDGVTIGTLGKLPTHNPLESGVIVGEAHSIRPPPVAEMVTDDG